MLEMEHAPRAGALVSVGAIGGLLAGFFGVGGGIVMVPLLLWSAGLNQRRAQATSLLAIAPAAVIGSASYAIGGVYPLVPALLVAAGGVLGAQWGATLLRTLSPGWLRWLFVVLVAAMAVTVMLTVPLRGIHIEVDWLTGLGLLITGAVMGISAGLFGIGGGIIAIPLLMLLFGTGDLEAKCVSLLAMAPAALSGSVSHLRYKTATIRDGLWIALGSALTAPLGTRGAFLLSENVANVVFGAFALGIAAVLAIRAIGDSRKSR